MNEPIILANESLLLNPDFDQGLSHWKKGPINPGWLSTAREIYNGVPIRFLKAGNESSVSQPLTVPKDPDTQARYVLSFLCETRHTEAGRLVVSIEEQSEELVIPLPPGDTRDGAEDEARLNNGQPLEYKPKEYEVELNLPFKAQDTITVSVFSPPNEPGDYISQVCITRIKLHLHLEPAKMQMLKLDDQSLPATAPLYLCLGASASLAHRLEFVPEPDAAWVGTQAALTSDENPLGAVVATPDWGVNQPLESAWGLDCPLIGDQDSYLFWINLLNQFTAEPYPVAVSLGHHRVVFREVHEAAYYPVLEYGQSVEVCVQVASYYTGQILEGLTVNWTVEGAGIQGAAVTNAEGWACFNFTPVAAGTFTIVASVVSLYYESGVVTHEFGVQVLETDPWKEVMAVVDNVPALWEEKTGYPNRGSTYALLVRLPSIFTGTGISLHWWGDSHEQLGVDVSPGLNESVPVPITLEMLWELISKDLLDGKFELSLSCTALLQPSPKKRMSQARNEVKVGAVREADKIVVVNEDESARMWVQVLHLLTSGDGEPVSNALVEWEDPDGTRTATTSGVEGWASHSCQLASAGDHIVTARIKAHADAIAIERPFPVKAIATSPWNTEVKFLLDGSEVDRKTLGVLCRRGRTHTLKVVPVAGSTWIGKNISLHWRRNADPLIGLTISGLGTPKLLLAEGVEWTLTSQAGTSKSSVFEIELRVADVSIVRELSGRLMSEDLTQELTLLLDQISALLTGQPFHPCLGARHNFNVLPHALSPLVGLLVSLTWTGTPADQLGAVVQPPLPTPQPLSAGGAIWMLDLTASAQAGAFQLTVSLPQLDFAATATPMNLDHNKVRFEALRESAVDPVMDQDQAWVWAWVVSHFTGEPVPGAAMNWEAEGENIELETDAEGWSGFCYEPKSAGLQPVKVSNFSPYDNFKESRSTAVKVLSSDPWEGLFASFDGQPTHRVGEKTYFPRRKTRHLLEVSAANDNALIGHKLTLGMTGAGPAELDIGFTPSNTLGWAQIFAGVLQYLFNVGDLKNGSCALRLAGERLARLSPPIPMSVGLGAPVLQISADRRANQTLDWGEALHWQVTVISVVSGKPMVGWTVTWTSPDIGVMRSVTDFYGMASVHFIPTTPGAAALKATVGDDVSNVSTTLTFVVNAPRAIAKLTSMDPPGYPGQEVSAQAIVVSAITDEPLAKVEVMWDYGNTSLTPTFTDADGKAPVRFKLDATGEPVLWASVRGGVEGWDVKSVSLTVLQDEPVIDELKSPFTTLPMDRLAQASASVRGRHGGAPMGQVPVSWDFDSLSIPPSTTNDDGLAPVAFKAQRTGKHWLTVSHEADSKSIEFDILPSGQMPGYVAIRRITGLPKSIAVGDEAIFEVIIEDAKTQQPVADKEVMVSVDGGAYVEKRTTPLGSVSMIRKGVSPGVMSFKVLIHNPLGDQLTDEVTVTVY